MAMTPMAEAVAATTSSATPTGLPQSAPKMKLVATIMISMLTRPRPNAVIALPRMIDDFGSGRRQQAAQRARVAFLQQAVDAELHREEQKERGEASGVERGVVQLLDGRGYVAHRDRAGSGPRALRDARPRRPSARDPDETDGCHRALHVVELPGIFLNDRQRQGRRE